MKQKSLPKVNKGADVPAVRFACVTNLRRQSLPDMVRIARAQNIPTLAIISLLTVDLLLAIGSLGVSLILWKVATGTPFYGLFAYTVESLGFPARQQLVRTDQQEMLEIEDGSQEPAVQQAAETVDGRVGIAPGGRSLEEMSGAGFSSAGGPGKTPVPAKVEPASVRKFRENALNFVKCYDGWGSFFFSMTYLGYLEEIKAAGSRNIVNSDECASIARSGNCTEDSELGECQLKLVNQEKVVRDAISVRIRDLRNNQANRAERMAEGNGADLKLMAAGGEFSQLKIDAILRTVARGPALQAIEPIQEVPQEQIREKGKEKNDDGENAVSVISDDIDSEASDRSESENPEAAGPSKAAARQYHLEHGENPGINDEDFFLLMSHINNKKIIIFNDEASEISIYDGRQDAAGQPIRPSSERVVKLRFDPKTMTSQDYEQIKGQYFQEETFYSFFYEGGQYYAQIVKGSARKSRPDYETTSALMAALHLKSKENPGGGDCGFYALWDNWDRLERAGKVKPSQGKGDKRNQREVRDAIYAMMKTRLEEMKKQLAAADKQTVPNSPAPDAVEVDIINSMVGELQKEHNEAYKNMKAKLDPAFAAEDYDPKETDSKKPDSMPLDAHGRVAVWETYMETVTNQDCVYGTESDIRLFARILGRPVLLITAHTMTGAEIMAYDSTGQAITARFNKPTGGLQIDRIRSFIDEGWPIMLVNHNNKHWTSLHTNDS